MSQLIHRLFNSSLSRKIRNVTGFRPSVFDQVFSDVFVWRQDASWETYFDLHHIAGLIRPEFKEAYQVKFLFYDDAGSKIHSMSKSIEYGQMERLNISSILPKRYKLGTFAAFHMVDNDKLFGKNITCLSERGYLSFRRRTDASKLRSYVHGDVRFIGMHLKTGKVRTAVRLGKENFYIPQVTFSDCDYYEFAVVNPFMHPLDVRVEYLNQKGEVTRECKRTFQGQSVELFSQENKKREVSYIRLKSKYFMLRPVIFKHYESHFDVFHA